MHLVLTQFYIIEENKLITGKIIFSPLFARGYISYHVRCRFFYASIVCEDFNVLQHLQRERPLYNIKRHSRQYLFWPVKFCEREITEWRIRIRFFHHNWSRFDIYPRLRSVSTHYAHRNIGCFPATEHSHTLCDTVLHNVDL